MEGCVEDLWVFYGMLVVVKPLLPGLPFSLSLTRQNLRCPKLNYSKPEDGRKRKKGLVS